MPNNLGQLHRQGIRTLKGVGIDTAALDARLLLCHAMGISHEQLVVESASPVDEKNQSQFENLIQRRAAGEPVARILGTREFWGLEFHLGTETLDPRPDSEALVAAVLEGIDDRDAPLRILDLGTGSGCLLIALLHECPRARGLGIDLSEAALSVARDNAARLGVENRVEFRCNSWAEDMSEKFDIIVSNPPYIPTAEVQILSPEVKDYDPSRALDGGEDGMDCYRIILKQLPDILCQHGIAAFETSPDLYTELWELIENQGQFEQIVGFKDLAGRDRGMRFRRPDLPL